MASTQNQTGKATGIFSRFGGLLTAMRSTRMEEAEQARRNPWLARALEEEKMEGQRIATWARSIALGVVAIMLVYVNPRLEVIYYEVLLAAFLLIGIAQFRAARVGQSGLELALILLDLVLLTVTLAVPNPFGQGEWPTAIQYRFGGFIYFYIFLASATLAYSWRTVQSIGIWAGVIWLTSVGLVSWLGVTYPELSSNVKTALAGYDRVFDVLDPNSVELRIRIQEVVVFVLVAAIIGMKSRRSSRLLMRQADMAEQRANLSRYFPPNMVEELASRSDPMGGTRTQRVAVLFADLVGFTRLAEESNPQEVIALLRSFHAGLEEAVFSNGGTLDKYLGDGVMATFGTPQSTLADAQNAINAAFAMQAAMDRINEEREAANQTPLHLSIGVHFGEVTLGDIGTARRKEFATLGDTVNVAARLEAASRELSCRIVISNDVMNSVDPESERKNFQTRMKLHGALPLRGRDEPVDVWTA